MAPYIPDLEQVQIGTETVFGTPVAGAVKLALVDKCTITPDVGIETLKEKRGSLQPGFVDVVTKHSGKAKVSGVATYEDLPYWLDSIAGIAAATGPTNFIRPYAGPTSAVQARRMLTLINGQTGAIARMTSSIVDELTLSCDAGGVLKFDASLIGKQVDDGTLAALTDRAQSPILGSDFKIYVDAVGGTVGATELTGLAWYSFNLGIKSNAAGKPSLGSIFPLGFREAAWKVSLKIKLELIAATAAFVTAFLANTLVQKQISLKATTGISAIAQFDVAGTVKKIGDLHTDTDGVVSVELEVDALYNAAMANSFKASITNTIAALL